MERLLGPDRSMRLSRLRSRSRKGCSIEHDRKGRGRGVGRLQHVDASAMRRNGVLLRGIVRAEPGLKHRFLGARFEYAGCGALYLHAHQNLIVSKLIKA